VAYWKTGSEMAFGMFGLGDYKVADMPYFSKDYPVYCLTKVESESSGALPDAVAHAYGGPGVNGAELCVANPLGVSMDQAGYMQIAVQNNEGQMSLFVQRLIQMMGGIVDTADAKNANTLDNFVKMYSNQYSLTFANMTAYIGSKPDWIDFDTSAKCVANRGVHPEEIGAAIGWACTQGVVDCDVIPQRCNESTYRVGDYVFSRYFEALDDANDPLVSCSFSGAAVLAPSAIYKQWTGSDICVHDKTTSSPTEAPTTFRGSGHQDRETTVTVPSETTSSNFLSSSATHKMSAAAFVIIVQFMVSVLVA